MKNKDMRFPQDIYFQYLNNIDGVKFTHREIDAIAFIISGRTTKKIASFFSIAPKTVDNHIHNIMMKLECNSRTSIIDFIEKSGKYSIVRQYYLSSLIKFYFKSTLKEISKLIKQEAGLCLMLSTSKESDHHPTIERLIRHLKLASINCSLKSSKQYETLTLTLKRPPLYTLFIVTGRQLSTLIKEGIEIEIKNEPSSLFQLIQRARENSTAFSFLLLNREEVIEIPKEISELGYMDLREQENYYFLVLNLLKRIYPSLNLDKIISEFTKHCSLIYGSTNKTDFRGWPKGQHVLEKGTLHAILQHFLRGKKGWKFLSLSSGFCACYILFLIFNNSGSHKAMTSSIRSDLIIPSETTLLDRPELLSQIDKGLKGSQPIQTIALVGIAGSGKTTLARQYAQRQKSSVIWEINAETKEALIGSFENLAQALSKTEEEKRAFRGIQEIKDTEEKEEKILQFVKDRLTLHPDWILIYDNVEKFSDFQKQFPQSNGAWGQGKVIVTTRDHHIQNMRTIPQVVHIGELDQTQKFNLFVKIVNQGVNRPWAQAQKEGLAQEEATLFLKAIPPFPLDISIAAYYIKSTHLPYDKYLKRLSEYKKEFIDVQENILKGTNDYPKVRYSIITLSLNQLIEQHKDFPYLLLFISLLDSQNIPRDLLEVQLNEVSVDDFIFNLKKYSLITNHSSTSYPWGSTFSIHRSTQEISLRYLMERLKLKPNHPLVQLIAQNLENYVAQLIEREDLSQLRLLVNHCEMFLSHNSLLTEELRGSLLGDLGGMYLYLGNYLKAKHFLEDSALQLQHDDPQQQGRMAQTLAYLGNVYGDLGNYEKAKNLLEQSLLIYERHFSQNHLGAAWALTYLGNVYRDLGDPEKAKSLLEKSLHLYQTHFPENHVGNARASAYLGIICTILGEPKKAKTLLEKSLLIYQKHLSTNHVGVAWVSAHLGNAYGELGDYEKAKNLLENSIALYKEHFPEDHIKVGWALAYLGEVYRVTGNYEKAKQALEKSILIYKKHLSENHIVIAGNLVYLGDVYKDLGIHEKAKSLLEESLRIYHKHFPENHPEIAWALAHLGETYRIMGNDKKAQALLEKSISIYRQHFSEDHTEIVWAKERLKSVEDKVSEYKTEQASENESTSGVKPAK